MLRYAITDGKADVRQGGNAVEALVLRCAGATRQGVDFLLIREKDLGGGELAGLSRRVIRAVRAERAGQAGTRVLVAERADVALAVGADGVHLSARVGELRAGQVRALFGAAGQPEPFVSVSCHTEDEVRRARADGASAILFAPVFGKWSAGVGVMEGVGLKRLHEACGAAEGVPVFALGGVTTENAAECVAAGAAGVAGIRMLFP